MVKWAIIGAVVWVAYQHRAELLAMADRAQYQAGRRVVRYIKRKVQEPSERDQRTKPLDALGKPFARGAMDELAGTTGAGELAATAGGIIEGVLDSLGQ